MKSSIELREAGYADIVYVARHMRLIDRTELYAFDETENPEKLARELTLYERYHWCAFIDWRPVTIISAIEQSPTLWRVGMFSTAGWNVFHGRMAKGGFKLHPVFLPDYGSDNI